MYCTGYNNRNNTPLSMGFTRDVWTHRLHNCTISLFVDEPLLGDVSFYIRRSNLLTMYSSFRATYVHRQREEGANCTIYKTLMTL